MMSIKCRIVSKRYLDFKLQPLILHKTDMKPRARLPRKKLQLHTHSALCWQFFAHFLSEILIKYNIKETVSKGEIWGPFYIPKGGGYGSI